MGSYSIDFLRTMAEDRLASLGLDSERYPMLYTPIEYTLAGGGKRIRPVLVLLACAACGGDPREALDAAVGVEVFHNFTLLHDDVMDKSDTRRGRPTVHKQWDENVAILSGDAMLTLATQLVSHVPDGALREVIVTFNDMAMRIYEGQALDMDFENRSEVSLEEYIDMIRRKTSALLSGALRIGALIAGASRETAEALAEYGDRLGLAFQIRDDYLDVYGDPATFGKPVGGDIANNKKTFLLISAMENAGDEGLEILRRGMTISDPQARIAEVSRIYTIMGVGEAASAAADAYAREASETLGRADITAEGREELEKLLHRLTRRVI